MLKNLFHKLKKDRPLPLVAPQLMGSAYRLPVSLVRGEGRTLWAADGKSYLDGVASAGETILGHNHPQVAKAISLQASKLLYVERKFHIQEQAQLAQRLSQISGLEQVFFGQVVAESLSVVDKLISSRAADKDKTTPLVLSNLPRASGRLGFAKVGLNDIDEIGKYASNTNVIAVHLTTGFDSCSASFADAQYLQSVRNLCDEHDWLLVADESQSALARSGNWFAYQGAAVQPDILIAGCGLGNGLPISICAAGNNLTELLDDADLFTRFGGNPFISQIALTVLDVIEKEQLCSRAANTGDLLCRKIQQNIATLSGVVDIRSAGLTTIIKFEKALPDFEIDCLAQGLVVGYDYRHKVAILTPALNLADNEAQQIAETLSSVIAQT